ncbi:MAG: hypothetical protein JO323_19630 [Acidobacteriia bacterium]|nr:hypothetical protein [Terriglobia bacterium]
MASLAAATGLAARKKKEEETQALPLPKDLPAAVVGETRHLTFHVTPLAAKGLLSQQVRDALRSLERECAGNPVLHIRAFVAGSGDLRRVRELVSEMFTERHQPLPALSLILAGGLALPGAQIELEAVANGKRELYPGGLAFFSAQPAFSDDPQEPVAPLLAKSLADLKNAVQLAAAAPGDVLRVTCFLSSLDKLNGIRDSVQSEYPKAALDYVQPQRAPQRAMAACEAVAGLRESGRRLAFRNGPGASARETSEVSLLASPRVILTGSQASFGFEDSDAHLALERLGKSLEPAGASLKDVAFLRVYPLSRSIEDQVRRQIPLFFTPESFPAGTALQFEGLPSADAGFAVDAVAAKD